MIKTFWLSFATEEDGSRGACIIDVTEDEAADALKHIEGTFPDRSEGSEWVAAAVRKAVLMGCNPGGEVAALEITGRPQAEWYHKNKLMTREEVEAIDNAHHTVDGETIH